MSDSLCLPEHRLREKGTEYLQLDLFFTNLRVIKGPFIFIKTPILVFCRVTPAVPSGHSAFMTLTVQFFDY